MNDERLLAKTGRTSTQWVEFLTEKAGQNIMNIAHNDMVRIIIDAGVEPWWAQTAAVRVERLIGRRVVGQTCTGSFAASASKTIVGNWIEVFADFLAFMEENLDTLPVPAAGEPRLSESEKWRYWKLNLADGTKVNLNCQAKPATKDGRPKTGLAIQHENLASAEDRETWKHYWRETLNHFAGTYSH